MMCTEEGCQMNLVARAVLTSSVLVVIGLFPIAGTAVERGKEHGCYYPPRALRRHPEGTTVLQFEIAVDGVVRDISVQESSGDLALGHTAVACAENWRYSQ